MRPEIEAVKEKIRKIVYKKWEKQKTGEKNVDKKNKNTKF